MADVLVSGIKISEMDLVNEVQGSEKVPTDQVGDKAISIDQILTYVNNKVKPTWGNIQGDINTQTDLINLITNQNAALMNEVEQLKIRVSQLET
ncbi:hypothetical protein AM24_089 [Acinetobacter phage AM24]|nr:hypothetical protein AM24_089 [Acinetobacter phage AM24]